MSQEFAELLPHSAKFGKIGMGAAQKKGADFVDLGKCWKMRILSLSDVSKKQRTSRLKFSTLVGQKTSRFSEACYADTFLLWSTLSCTPFFSSLCAELQRIFAWLSSTSTRAHWENVSFRIAFQISNSSSSQTSIRCFRRWLFPFTSRHGTSSPPYPATGVGLPELHTQTKFSRIFSLSRALSFLFLPVSLLTRGPLP